MVVFTVINDAQCYGYKYLLRPSCKYHKLHLVTYLHRGRWQSNHLKPQYVRSFLRTRPRDELVLSVDGNDTVFVCSEEEIVAKYSAFDAPVVFSAEKNCSPQPALAACFPVAPTEFRFLNSGGFMGPAGVLLEMLERYWPFAPFGTSEPPLEARVAALPEPSADGAFGWSDQFLWILLHLAYPGAIRLDHYTSIFLELAPTLAAIEAGRADFDENGERSELYASEVRRLRRECIVEEGRLLHTRTGTRPCHVHFNSLVAKLVAEQGTFLEIMPWLRRSWGTRLQRKLAAGRT